MRHALVPLLTLSLSSTILSAQTVQTFPNTLPATFAGNSWPWNNTTAAGFRTQFIYDASNLGSTTPVLIQRLRFTRSTPTATTTGLLNGVTLSLSTCPVAWNALSATYATQIGADVKVIFQGNLSFNATQWYVDIQLPSPFFYDPSKGGLCFDFVRGSLTGNTYPGAGGYATGTAAAPFKANRVFGDPVSATGTLDSPTTAANGYANAVEVTWIYASGLHTNFKATPTSGPGPLQVQFTDATYTSNPPITSWAWDFDGDNKIDSTLQNPTFTYPKTGWDAQYDVTLTTTDGTNPPSKLTKKAFITVDPSNALAVNFGAGSTIPSVPGPIKLPAFSTLYTSTAIRGLYFQAPQTFIITGLRVPPDSTLSQQAVSLFTMPAKPPAYSASYTVTASDQKFFTSTAPANTIIPMTPPIIIQKDTWVGVLGAGYSGTGTTVSTSYATPSGPFLSSIGTTPVTLYRLLMQGTPTPFITNLGLGPVSSEDAAQIGRVEIFVVGNYITPELTTIGRPALGLTPTLDMRANIAGAQGGLIFLGGGRLPGPVPTPYGNLLIQLPIYVSVFIPTGTGKLPLPIPNDAALTGLLLDFQGMAFDVTNNIRGMTNGTEWFVGK